MALTSVLIAGNIILVNPSRGLVDRRRLRKPAHLGYHFTRTDVMIAGDDNEVAKTIWSYWQEPIILN